MEIFYAMVITIIGCILGSFFNVVGDRMPQGQSIVRPGSHCTNCGHNLKWYELIPILSYLVQRGRCRKCNAKLSIVYLLTEVTTGILFLASYLIFGLSYQFVISIAIVSFLVIIIVSDINYLIIPDGATLFFSITLIFIKWIGEGYKAMGTYLLSGLGLFLFMYLIMILGNVIFKKESLGGGDVKLMFFVGLAIGLFNGFFTIFLSSVLALPFSLLFYYKNDETVIPFGPFILIATLAIFLSGFNVLEILVLV